jgi:hypothetical protein
LCTVGAALAASPARAADSDSWFDGQAIGQTLDSITDPEAWTEQGHWRLAYAPTALHFRPSTEHRHVWAIGVERQRPDNWLAGFSYFSNSFGQPSAYAYVGRRFDGILEGVPPLFAQASVGVLYGYKGKFKNKVALNFHGFAPGALVGLGWHFTPSASLVVHLLGDAGVMFQFGYDLP